MGIVENLMIQFPPNDSRSLMLQLLVLSLLKVAMKWKFMVCSFKMHVIGLIVNNSSVHRFLFLTS